jgi:hypothetical protein
MKKTLIFMVLNKIIDKAVILNNAAISRFKAGNGASGY